MKTFYFYFDNSIKNIIDYLMKATHQQVPPSPRVTYPIPRPPSSKRDEKRFSRTHIVHSDKPNFHIVYEELKQGCFQNTYYNMNKEQFKEIKFLKIGEKKIHIIVDKLIKIFENEESTIALSIREIKFSYCGKEKTGFLVKQKATLPNQKACSLYGRQVKMLSQLECHSTDLLEFQQSVCICFLDEKNKLTIKRLVMTTSNTETEESICVTGKTHDQYGTKQNGKDIKYLRFDTYPKDSEKYHSVFSTPLNLRRKNLSESQNNFRKLLKRKEEFEDYQKELQEEEKEEAAASNTEKGKLSQATSSNTVELTHQINMKAILEDPNLKKQLKKRREIAEGTYEANKKYNEDYQEFQVYMALKEYVPELKEVYTQFLKQQKLPSVKHRKSTWSLEDTYQVERDLEKSFGRVTEQEKISIELN